MDMSEQNSSAFQHGEVIAWLVVNCPEFYFFPSARYDQGFTSWFGSKFNCPAYWNICGETIIELGTCDEAEATHWVINGLKVANNRETANAARELGRTVIPVKMGASSTPLINAAAA